MKVLIYAHAFAPRIGGAETFVMTLARGLARRENKPGPAAPEAYGATKITVVTPTPADGFEDANLPFAVVRQSNPWQLFRLIQKANVVQLAGPAIMPLFLALVLGKKVVVEQHEYSACCPNGQLFIEEQMADCPGHFMARRYAKCLDCNRPARGSIGSLRLLLLAFFRRWLCHRVTRNVPITDHVTLRLQLPRSHRIYYGIEPLPPSVTRESGSVQENSALTAPITFAYLGRFVSEKGVELLLHAASSLVAGGYRLRLDLIGDGPERKRLELLVEKLNLGELVTFTGFLSGPALQEALSKVSVVVMPSLWQETAGLAAMEQMMRGRLVIASEIGGLSEVVADAGLKFAPGDVQGLAACMERAMTHPHIVSQLGAQAQARALSAFQKDRMVDDYWELYRGLLSPDSLAMHPELGPRGR